MIKFRQLTDAEGPPRVSWEPTCCCSRPSSRAIAAWFNWVRCMYAGPSHYDQLVFHCDPGEYWLVGVQINQLEADPAACVHMIVRNEGNCQETPGSHGWTLKTSLFCIADETCGTSEATVTEKSTWEKPLISGLSQVDFPINQSSHTGVSKQSLDRRKSREPGDLWEPSSAPAEAVLEECPIV